MGVGLSVWRCVLGRVLPAAKAKATAAKTATAAKKATGTAKKAP